MIDILPRTSKHIVGLNITPRTITCSWIEHTLNDQTPYELKAYKHMLIEVHPKTSLTIYNPTRLRTMLSTFLERHNLEDAFVVIALSGQGLVEKQVMLSKPAVNLNKVEQELLSDEVYAGKTEQDHQHMLWHYYCLQESSPGSSAPWYCCGMKRELLFQYLLLAISTRLNLLQITTPTMALLKAYNFLKQHGSTQSNKANIVEYLKLNGHIRIRSHQEHAAIVESFGLFLLGKQIYEEH